MTRSSQAWLRPGAVALAAWLLLPVVGLRAQEAEAAAPAAKAKDYTEIKPPVKCTLVVGKLPTDGELLGRVPESKLLVAKINFKTITVEEKLVNGVEFIVDYVEDTVEVLLREEKFKEAADLLVGTYATTIPYLDLPDNNAAGPLLNAASCYLKAAEREASSTGKLVVTPAATENYKRAYLAFRWLVKAEWFSGAKVAEVKALFCLLRMGRIEQVEKALEEMDEPAQGDASFGVYWMVRAYLFYQRQEFREAIGAASRSLVFETKDLDSFPEALLLSGQCYEDMLEYHRARDVYYEVAKLFYRTDLGEVAFRRLQFIMAQGYSRKEEELKIEMVFFGTAEDLNQKADEFIKMKLEEERLRKEKEELKRKQEEVEKKINS